VSDTLLDRLDRPTRGFRRIVWLMVSLIIAPTALLLGIGIAMLALLRSRLDLVLGVLTLALVVCLGTGAAIALALLHREARLARLQTDFVSKVSHELRTPLTSIRMFAEMLRDETAPEAERRRCLEALEREAERLSARIERLLDWGRMEAGGFSFRRVRLDPGEVARRAAATFRGTAVGRTVTLEEAVGERLPAIEGDPEALADALLNLLDNAAKYGAGRPVTLGADADGRHVRLWVRDRGIGIPRREQRRIFATFYRVDDRLSSAVQGTGLGLAIVERIARAHGGRVEVESEPGRGATFTLVLPVAEGSG